MRTWVRQKAVFELNERSEFSEKGDLQLALGRVIPPPLRQLKELPKGALLNGGIEFG